MKVVKLKEKKCKGCEKDFLPKKLIQPYCSPACHYKSLMKPGKNVKENKKEPKKKGPSLSSLEKRLWKIFSEFIRRRDSDENGIGTCCTCGFRAHWKKMDAGHFISRKQKSTKFDEINNHIQCKGCNGPGSGKQYEYSRFIDAKYGEGTAEKILLKSKQTCIRKRYDLEVMIEIYQQKLKDLQ